jgi:hypothetical protein
MASGKLGGFDLSASTLTPVYTVPTDNFSVVSVSICNRGHQAVTVRVAVQDQSVAIGLKDYIEYGTEILAKGVLERTGIIMSVGQILHVWASNANVSAVVFGIETSTV